MTLLRCSGGSFSYYSALHDGFTTSRDPPQSNEALQYYSVYISAYQSDFTVFLMQYFRAVYLLVWVMEGLFVVVVRCSCGGREQTHTQTETTGHFRACRHGDHNFTPFSSSGNTLATAISLHYTLCINQ